MVLIKMIKYGAIGPDRDRTENGFKIQKKKAALEY
ncbi:hypothetical protein CYPRO_2135 [Cyclonatronum proteinivorum]|uniref:Uncharacterized protein n=1 Tax=Cyclonatronum proteinivorum TaxID=1457365 RepID=A0A345ULN2_9BACT|nr:hypothetical protein CYPRO_2135 [Cyclonatronum proteinivorum]